MRSGVAISTSNRPGRQLLKRRSKREYRTASGGSRRGEATRSVPASSRSKLYENYGGCLLATGCGYVAVHAGRAEVATAWAKRQVRRAYSRQTPGSRPPLILP